MSSEMNAVDRPLSTSDDFFIKAARYGGFGWIAFFVTLAALIIQNIVYALLPPDVLASENGQIIGQVVFDEPHYRSEDTITGDLKDWVLNCTTVNKNSVYEDLSVCLTHMDKDLAEAQLAFYTDSNYAKRTELGGCNRTDIQHDDPKSTIDIDRDSQTFYAETYGDVLCLIPGEKPVSQAFALRIEGDIVHKSIANPLGLKVTSYEDI